jgi:uncharacterized repeat protein (TIGR01451 family)
MKQTSTRNSKKFINKIGLSLLFISLICISAMGQTSVRAFGLAYSANLKGGTTLLGNTSMAIKTSGRNGTIDLTKMNETSNASNGQGGLGFSQYGNNNSNMQFVDIDNTAGTSNSSSADLNLPTGLNTIKFARLYWGGRVNNSVVTGAPDTLRKIKIRKGTTGSYSLLTTTSANVITKSDNSGLVSSSTIYESFIDITSFVNSNGAGIYTVADLPLSPGSSNGGQYGAWAIAIAYENLSLPYNSIRMYDGFAEVFSSGSVSSLSLTLSGLNIPSTPLTSDEAVMGTVSWEGDADLAATSGNPLGDYIQVNGTTVSNAVNPATNFWNGSISKNGSYITTKNPNYSNQMGIDIDEVNVGTGFNIQPNATSVNIKFGTEADQYFPSIFTFSVRVKDPTITLTKSVTDANASGYVDANEVLTYNLSGTNQGVGSSYNTYIVDTLPANVTYVPNSLEIITSPGNISGIKTDGADADQAFFGINGSKNYVKFNLGVGANGTNGGELPIGSAGNFSVKFKVKVGAIPSIVINTARLYGQSVVGDQFTNDATAIMDVNYQTNNSETAVSCDSYLWHGTTYTTSGNYTFSYLNTNNVASVDTLHLTINYGTHNSYSVSVCNNYTWHGVLYNVSGNYIYIFNNLNNSGCEITDTLHLTINTSSQSSNTASAITSYNWNGNTYSTSGTYSWNGTNTSSCDSIAILNLTIDNVPVAVNDLFAPDQDTPFNGNVSGNDQTSLDGGNTWSLTSGPSHGTITFNTDGSFTYTPALGFTDIDTFYYSLCDVDNDCSSAVVSLIVQAGGTTPITLSSFNVRLANNETSVLSWNAQSEINANRYEIERSENAINFSNRGNVTAIGSPTRSQDYTYNDALNTSASKVYYRLKMIDNDGSYKYSSIVTLKLKDAGTTINTYPNPFAANIKIDIVSQIEEVGHVKLIAVDGRVVNQFDVKLTKGNNAIQMNNLAGLPKSTYTVEVSTATNKFTKRVVKN